MSDEKPAKKAAKEKTEKSGYDVNALAKELGIEPASVRVALRKAEIEKPGKKYEWSNKADFMKVVSTLKKGAKKEKEAA